MANITLNTRIALKSDTAAKWASSELILLKGEFGIETDTNKFKIGNGVSRYSELPYVNGSSVIVKTNNPTDSDVSYDVGTIWLNTTDEKVFILKSNQPTAVWLEQPKLADVMKYSEYDPDKDGSVSKADTLKFNDTFIGVNDGDTSGLWTANKTNEMLSTKADKTEVGTLGNLTTNVKTDVVSAINELDSELGTKADKTEVGTLSELTTSAKSNLVSAINELDAEVADKADTTALENYIQKSSMGVAEGVATLDTQGKIPSSQLPSFVDDVIEAENFSALPETGESGKIYVTLDTNKTYRWSGSAYVEISASLALGETTGTAYEGSKGKANADAIATLQSTIGGLGSLAYKSTVATTDIDDGAVVESKLAENAVTSAKIATGAVTDEKIVTVNAAKLIQTPDEYIVFNCGDSVK